MRDKNKNYVGFFFQFPPSLVFSGFSAEVLYGYCLGADKRLRNLAVLALLRKKDSASVEYQGKLLDLLIQRGPARLLELHGSKGLAELQQSIIQFIKAPLISPFDRLRALIFLAGLKEIPLEIDEAVFNQFLTCVKNDVDIDIYKFTAAIYPLLRGSQLQQLLNFIEHELQTTVKLEPNIITCLEAIAPKLEYDLMKPLIETALKLASDKESPAQMNAFSVLTVLKPYLIEDERTKLASAIYHFIVEQDWKSEGQDRKTKQTKTMHLIKNIDLMCPLQLFLIEKIMQCLLHSEEYDNCIVGLQCLTAFASTLDSNLQIEMIRKSLDLMICKIPERDDEDDEDVYLELLTYLKNILAISNFDQLQLSETYQYFLTKWRDIFSQLSAELSGNDVESLWKRLRNLLLGVATILPYSYYSLVSLETISVLYSFIFKLSVLISNAAINHLATIIPLLSENQKAQWLHPIDEQLENITTLPALWNESDKFLGVLKMLKVISPHLSIEQSAVYADKLLKLFDVNYPENSKKEIIYIILEILANLIPRLSRPRIEKIAKHSVEKVISGVMDDGMSFIDDAAFACLRAIASSYTQLPNVKEPMMTLFKEYDSLGIRLEILKLLVNFNYSIDYQQSKMMSDTILQTNFPDEHVPANMLDAFNYLIPQLNPQTINNLTGFIVGLEKRLERRRLRVLDTVSILSMVLVNAKDRAASDKALALLKADTTSSPTVFRVYSQILQSTLLKVGLDASNLKRKREDNDIEAMDEAPHDNPTVTTRSRTSARP